MKLNEDKRFSEHRRFKAKWIHCNPRGNGAQYGCFRKVIEISENTTDVRIYITANKIYKLFIDGEQVGEGPLRSSKHYWAYDRYSLTERMTPGVHTIAVIVHMWNPSWNGPLGLLAELEIQDDAGKQYITTDKSWKTITSDAWVQNAPGNLWAGGDRGVVEIYDTRLLDKAWMYNGFDDHHWNEAGTFRTGILDECEVGYVSRIWEYLVERDLPQFKSDYMSPGAICNAGECIGSDHGVYKEQCNETAFEGLADIRPLRFATLENTEAFLPDGIPIVAATNSMGLLGGGVMYQPAVVFDLGEIVNGYVCLSIMGNCGDVIDISFAQVLDNGRVLPYSAGIFRVKRFVLNGEKQEISFFNYENFRYFQITLRSKDARITLYSAGVRTVSYPFTQAAEFSCSDKLLTEIWHAEQRTAALCMLDLVMDNTWREKQGWGGDCTCCILAGLTVFGDLELFERYLRMFAYDQHPSGTMGSVVPSTVVGTGIIDHPLAIPLRIRDYYMYTGKTSLLRELYPSLRRLMAFMERYEFDGILEETPGSLYIDWADLDRSTVSIVLNFYYGAVLQAMEEIASLLGQERDREIYHAKYELLKLQTPQFWNTQKGAFPDSTSGSNRYSEHTNAMAVFSGLAEQKYYSSILESIFCTDFDPANKQQVTISGPPFAIYVLGALCAMGKQELALEFIRKRQGTAIKTGLHTLPEGWIYVPNGGESAAQSTLSATYTIAREIIGLKPATAGFEQISIHPHPCDIEQLDCRLPTEYGYVAICWEKHTDRFELRVDIPCGITKAEVAVPYLYREIAVTHNQQLFRPSICNEKLILEQWGSYTITYYL